MDVDVALSLARGDKAEWLALGLATTFELEVALTDGGELDSAAWLGRAGLRERGTRKKKSIDKE